MEIKTTLVKYNDIPYLPYNLQKSCIDYFSRTGRAVHAAVAMTDQQYYEFAKRKSEASRMVYSSGKMPELMSHQELERHIQEMQPYSTLQMCLLGKTDDIDYLLVKVQREVKLSLNLIEL